MFLQSSKSIKSKILTAALEVDQDYRRHRQSRVEYCVRRYPSDTEKTKTKTKHEVLLLLIQHNKTILLPGDCLLKWDDVETSLIMCKKHYNDYDNIDMKAADMNYKTEQFIKRVIDPAGSQYSAILLNELR
jgi:hypothetical protein